MKLSKIKYRGQVKDQIFDQTWGLVKKQALGQVQRKIENQFWDQGDQALVQICHQVWDPVWNQVWNQVRGQLKDPL